MHCFALFVADEARRAKVQAHSNEAWNGVMSEWSDCMIIPMFSVNVAVGCTQILAIVLMARCGLAGQTVKNWMVTIASP
jgi:hypothetical protein